MRRIIPRHTFGTLLSRCARNASHLPRHAFRMHIRILDITFHAAADFQRIYFDAGTPPLDRGDVSGALEDLVEAADPRNLLRPVLEHAPLLEFVIRSPTSGHRYGMLLVDLGHVADAIAYWREPPLYRDAASPIAHGFSRAHALRLAIQRLEEMR